MDQYLSRFIKSEDMWRRVVYVGASSSSPEYLKELIVNEGITQRSS